MDTEREWEMLRVKIMANYSLIEEIYIQREAGGDLDGFCDYRIRFPATEGLIKHWRPDGARVLVKKALDHLLS